MSNPILRATVIDPGSLSRPTNTSQIPIYVGICESGVDFEIHEFAQEDDLLGYGGAGHLIDVAQSALQFAESVKIMKVPISVAGEFAADSTDEQLTTTSYTGTPLQFLQGQIVITTAGGAISSGNVKAKLTLDNWDIPFVDASYTDEFAIASTGIVVLPGTGGLAVHLTTTQTPTVGETLNFHTTPGHYNATSVGSCLTPLLSPSAGIFSYVSFTGDAASASAANTIALAIISLNETLYNKGRFYPMLCGAGVDTDTAVATAFASTLEDPPFVSAGYGAGYWQSPRATPSRGRYGLREHDVASIVIAGIVISTDPGRRADGAIAPLVGVDYDAALRGSLLHDARIGVFTSEAPESTGYFLNRQRMLCKSDSNFESWQFAAIMCTALRATRRGLFRFQLDSLRRTATSTLDPRDAADIKSACENDIDGDLITPENVRGLPGHISARTVTINLATVLPEVQAAVQLRPFGYPTDLEATIEYGNAAQ